MSSYHPIALQIFEEIRAEFPELSAELHSVNAYNEPELRFPQQTNLVFEVVLELDGDELHCSAEEFRMCSFPVDDADRTTAFKDAVVGLINGEHRILQHYRGDRVVKSVLQRKTSEEWEPIYTASSLSWSWPWLRKQNRVIKNDYL